MTQPRFRVPFLLALVVGFGVAAEQTVVVPLAQGFNRGEFYLTAMPLAALGYRIEVVTPGGGTVIADKDGVTPDRKGRDVRGAIAIPDRVDGYAGMVIPGGYSPGFLERDPAAVALVADFARTGRPIGGVCHGPRLLMKAGALEGRVFTALHDVPSEVPESWRAVADGFVDRSVVRDRGLVTGRYPGDLEAFIRAFAAELAARGGLPVPGESGTVGVLDRSADNGVSAKHRRWLWLAAAGVWGPQVAVVDDPAKVGPVEADTWIAIGADLDGAVALPEDADDIAILRAILAAAPDAPATEPDTEGELVAILALRRGFDDRVVAGLRPALVAAGYRVVPVAHEAGWVRGHHGVPVEATATYAEAPSARLVVAPGGWYPESLSDARQGETASWLPEHGERDRIREAWLRAAWSERGAELWLIGMDALRIGRGQEVFDGMAFAAPTSTRWSWGKQGGPKFSREALAEPAERLLTARGTRTLAPLVARLLGEEDRE